MALKRGLIGLDTHMPTPCRGGLRLGNRVFRCWKKEGHGSLDLIGAVAASCDVYFYQVGLRLGLKAILEDGVLMGFRDPSGIDLENEKNPICPASTAYFDKLYGPRHWSPPATILNFSIGQGEITQTLINMMKFYEGAGERGAVLDAVHRAAVVGQVGGPRTHRAQLDGLRHSLIAVVERGTAAASRRRDLAVAGKTGTAQNSHGKDHGWFIGFAPADKPELIVGAIMEFSEHGTTVAPYVVRTLRRELLGPDTVGTIKIKTLIDETHAAGHRAATRRAQSRLGRRAGPGGLHPAGHAHADGGRVAAAATGTAVRGSTVDRQLLLVSARAHPVRPPHALFGRPDRRAHARGRGVAPAVHLGGRRRRGGGRGLPHRRPGCWSGWRRCSMG